MTPRAFVFFLTLFFPLAAFSAEGRFCLQTFNVYGPAYASQTTWRLEQLGRELQEEPCDAIQFQELWKESQFGLLQGALTPARMAGLWADHIRGDRALVGLGSFFAGSILKARSDLYRANNGANPLDWARGLTGVQKGFTILEAKLDDEPALLFVNTHTHPTDAPTRFAQLGQLVHALYTDPRAAEMPVLFTADLNATPGSLELEILENLLLFRDAYREVNGAYGPECTYCANNRYSWSNIDRVIDFTLFRSAPGVALSPTASVINLQGKNGPLSDHYGVRSELAWAERTPVLWEEEDGRVVARRIKALATLAKVRKGLESSRLKPVRRELETVAELERLLKAKGGAPLVDALFRTP